MSDDTELSLREQMVVHGYKMALELMARHGIEKTAEMREQFCDDMADARRQEAFSAHLKEWQAKRPPKENDGRPCIIPIRIAHKT